MSVLTRRRAIVGTAAALISLIVGGTAVLVGTNSTVPISTSPSLLFHLLVLRDLGSLPNRTGWCGTATHCYLMQQSSGAAADTGSTGGWDMSPTGTPRAGVVTSIPVLDSTDWADTTTEVAAWFSVGNYYSKSSVTALTEPVTFTAVFYAAEDAGTAVILDLGYQSAQGYWLYWSSNSLRVAARGGGAAAKAANVNEISQDAAWHCLTVTMNGASTSAWADGAAATWSTAWGDYGTPTGSINVGIGDRAIGGVATTSGVARLKISESTLGSISSHQADCGALWQAPGGEGDSKPSSTDDTWTQTGVARCYPTSANTAICVPGGLIPYAWDGSNSRLAWPVDRSAINRLLNNGLNLTCANWTCTAASIVTAVAPDGSNTAASITMSGGSVAQTAVGFANSTSVYPRLWAKCSAGTLDLANAGGTGHWTVDCSAVGGVWTLLTATHAAVTVVQAWASDGSGTVNITLSGADVVAWLPTITEEAGTSIMTIPTTGSPVSTGDPLWATDNTGNVYYSAGAAVTSVLNELDGTCLATSGTSLLLSGASTCNGLWHSLKIEQ